MISKKIHCKATLKQIKKIERLLKCHEIKVNKLYRNGYYPLYIAVSNDRLDLVKSLLKHNGTKKINVVSKDGLTALHLASINNNTEIVELLLKNGADPEILDKNGLNSIYWSIMKNNVGVAKLLLKYKDNSTIQLIKKIYLDECTLVDSAKMLFSKIVKTILRIKTVKYIINKVKRK